MKLEESFYERSDVVRIAKDLLGKYLFTSVGGIITGGMIVETEAYSWREKGCHAYASKKTQRNAVMFRNGGVSYVYLCYGMHYLFNVVTNTQEVPEAVLIRALEPVIGIPEMENRRGKKIARSHLTSGPGKLTKALGIDKNLNGKSLIGEEVWLEDRNVNVPKAKIGVSSRIGIDYAGEDAELPWRFFVKENPWVSR
jgi:DNA-3-methyladenine glycosylase